MSTTSSSVMETPLGEMSFPLKGLNNEFSSLKRRSDVGYTFTCSSETMCVRDALGNRRDVSIVFNCVTVGDDAIEISVSVSATRGIHFLARVEADLNDKLMSRISSPSTSSPPTSPAAAVSFNFGKLQSCRGLFSTGGCWGSIGGCGSRWILFRLNKNDYKLHMSQEFEVKLRLVFLSIVPPTEVTEVVTEVASVDDTPKRLSKHLEMMVANSENTDIELICEEKTFPTYKFILKYQSSVFRSMLESNATYSELTSGTVKIKGSTAKAVGAMISFLTYGEVSKEDLESGGGCFHIYNLAEKYDILSLKHYCRDFMLENMSESKLVEFVETAWKFEDEMVLEAVTSFIIDNKVKMIGSEEWRNLNKENPGKFYDLMCAVCQ